ncbi:MAG TPA: type II toxin-antitoxin system HipA family toxin [Gammaproteobacteria bacterium]|nr:type II toxin-antitoxin system HipA family toxin [Gammaproteobacteria bacterium]
MNGERVGEWRIDRQGQNEFRYDEAWMTSNDARPISLSMPLQPPDAPYRGELVEGFFDNLLPDAAEIRRRIQARFGAASNAAFDLLTEVGRDCVGAIQLLPLDQEPTGLQTIDGEQLDEQGVADTLQAATSAVPLGQREAEPFRISIAGAQEKTALLKYRGRWHRPLGATPSTHIFKLPLGRIGNMRADLSTSVENEWLCSKIVSAYGLPAANSEIGDFAGRRTLIVERFDRRLAGTGAWWLRLPQEDMCQATGTPPARRYESDGGPGIAAISKLLLGSRSSSMDRRNFFRAQVLFWMLCATDGHAKNFSVFIEPAGRFTLTPLYDVISAYPILGTAANQLAPQKAKMAMAAFGKNRHYGWAEIQPRHWLTTAAATGLDATVKEDIAELVGRTPKVIAKVSSMLPQGFPTNVARAVFDGLSLTAERLEEIA